MILSKIGSFLHIAQKRNVSFMCYYPHWYLLCVYMGIIINFTKKINIFFQILY